MRIWLRDNYFEYALYFLISSLFFGSALLSIATSMFYVTLILRKPNKALFPAVSPWLSVVYFLVNLIILLIVFDNTGELITILKFLPFILFPFIFWNYKDIINSSEVLVKCKKVFLFFALSSFFVSITFGLYRMFFFETNINNIYITYNFITDLFGVHHIYLSVYYVVAIIFCFDFYNHVMHKKYILFVVILFVAIILLSSRTTIAAMFIVLILKLLMLKKLNFRKLIILVTASLIFGTVLTFSLPTLKNRTFNLVANVSSYSGTSFRFKIWKNTIEVFDESKFIGHGIGKSQNILMDQYHKVNFRRAYLGNFNAHNQYLQTLIDSGILGFLSLIAMLFSFAMCSKFGSNLSLISILVFITLLTESFLIRQGGIVFYCLIVNLLLVVEKNDTIQ